MSKEIKVDERIWEFVDDKLNIVNPEEVSNTFDESDILLFDFQFSGIKKGMEFSEKDYEKLSMELSIMDRTNDVIELGHIYKRQCERDSILDDLYYHQDKNVFKKCIDTEDIENIEIILSDVYQDEFGFINDDILKIDAHYMIDKIKRVNNINNVIDTLLD